MGFAAGNVRTSVKCASPLKCGPSGFRHFWPIFSEKLSERTRKNTGMKASIISNAKRQTGKTRRADYRIGTRSQNVARRNITLGWREEQGGSLRGRLLII